MIAALTALWVLTQLGATAPEHKARRLGVFVVLLALSGFQVLRGLGIVG